MDPLIKSLKVYFAAVQIIHDGFLLRLQPKTRFPLPIRRDAVASTIRVKIKWDGHGPIRVLHKWRGGAMATPGQLVQTMADVLGIPATTVAQYDRQLAEAGLRTVGGRGTSAAKVTAIDAANLLITVLGSPVSGPSIKAAKQTCQTFGSLPVDHSFSDTQKFKQFGLLSVAKLPKKHTFREALAALIQGASHGELFRISDRDDEFMEDDYLFGVTVESMRPWAEISGDSVGAGDLSDISRLRYRSFEPETKQFELMTSDLGQRREISYRTLRVLGNLIANGARG